MKNSTENKNLFCRVGARLLKHLRPLQKQFSSANILERIRKPSFYDGSTGEFYMELSEQNALAPQMFLSLDEFTGKKRFWVGYCSTKAHHALLDQLCSELYGAKEKSTLRVKDWKKERYGSHLGASELGLPFRENYGGDFFFGYYNWNIEGVAAHVDSSKAFLFFQKTLGVVFENTPKASLRMIEDRQGAGKFREIILNAYKKCAISGCDLRQLLDAAHVRPYSKSGEAIASNGILLRTDLHTLFDYGMLKIHPSTRTVHIDASIKDKSYKMFDGIALGGAARKIKEEYLAERWKIRLA